MSDSLRHCGLSPTRLLCPWDSPGKNTGVGCHALLQGIFPTQGWNSHLLRLLHWQEGSFHFLCVLSHFSHVHLSATLWTCSQPGSSTAHQASLSMGLSRQEYWSGLPCHSPGDLPNPGIELSLLSLLHWQSSSLLLEPPTAPLWQDHCANALIIICRNYYIKCYHSIELWCESHSIVYNSLLMQSMGFSRPEYWSG